MVTVIGYYYFMQTFMPLCMTKHYKHLTECVRLYGRILFSLIYIMFIVPIVCAFRDFYISFNGDICMLYAMHGCIFAFSS